MLIPGEVFGSYQIAREIGRGGMGAVYEAEHIHLRKRVAIKVLLPERATDATTAQRFIREGEAASRIQHEHVVDVIDVGAQDGIFFLVMELLEGESLADLLERSVRLSCEEMVDIALPLIDALATAHEAGVIHRDIKPENIFLARGRRGRRVPKLVDFGISRIQTPDDPEVARLTSSMVLVGTPCYMAPESARGAKNSDARSDQYALGVVLYECITGVLPFERTSVFEMLSAILTERPTDPGALVPALDVRMEQVIQRAMSREPGDRFADMRAMGAALLPLASAACRAQWAAEFSGDAIDLLVRPSDTTPRVAMHRAAERTPAPMGAGAITLDEHNTPVSLPLRNAAAPSRSAKHIVGVAALVAFVLGAFILNIGSSPAPRAPEAPHAAARETSALRDAGTPPAVVEAPRPLVEAPPVAPAAVVTAPPSRRATTRVRRANTPVNTAVSADAPAAQPAVERPAAPVRSGAQSLLRDEFDPAAR